MIYKFTPKKELGDFDETIKKVLDVPKPEKEANE